jgi:hypothetical protein
MVLRQTLPLFDISLLDCPLCQADLAQDIQTLSLSLESGTRCTGATPVAQGFPSQLQRRCPLFCHGPMRDSSGMEVFHAQPFFQAIYDRCMRNTKGPCTRFADPLSHSKTFLECYMVYWERLRLAFALASSVAEIRYFSLNFCNQIQNGPYVVAISTDFQAARMQCSTANIVCPPWTFAIKCFIQKAWYRFSGWSLQEVLSFVRPPHLPLLLNKSKTKIQ